MRPDLTPIRRVSNAALCSRDLYLAVARWSTARNYYIYISLSNIALDTFSIHIVSSISKFFFSCLTITFNIISAFLLSQAAPLYR
jgi:hypothetical protein